VLSVGAGFISKAERHTLAINHAILVTQSFVEDNGGAWPASWADLEPYSNDTIDVRWVAKNVEYDFNADTETLATQSKYSFSGIRPKKPFYFRHDSEIILLIKTLQNSKAKPAG
jgi:hypothetical protein